MSIRESDDYSDISPAWFLGDEGELAEYNIFKPSKPGDFHPQLARLFLEYIQIGLTDRQACIEVPMSEKWPRTWSRGGKKAPSTYIRALEVFARPMQFDVMANDVVDIADGTDALANENMLVDAVENPLRDALHRSREINIKEYRKRVADRVSSRKWWVSKMAPSKYGDKVQLDHGNANQKPFMKVDFNNLTTDELIKLVEVDEQLEKRKASD